MTRPRTPLLALCAALALAPAGPAHARIAFDKHVNSLHPTVYVAADDGSHQRRLATGLFPKISPDGRRVAYVRPGFGGRDELRVVRARGGRSRPIVRAGRIDDVHWSPDSRAVGAELRRGLFVYDVRRAASRVLGGAPLTGFSFSPDSRSLVYGHAARRDLDAASDLFVVARSGGRARRITANGRSLNPLWTTRGIVFDEQTVRPNDAPAYDLFSIRPGGAGERRITTTSVPPLASGLVPHSASADGSRLLAEFSEQDEVETYAVDAASGAARRLGRFYVPGGISRDGRTIVAQTGGPNPGGRHTLISVRFTGGAARLLVRGGSDPDWTG